MMGEYRESRKRKAQLEMSNHHASSDEEKAGSAPQVRVVRSGHRASERSCGRERLCKHKYSNYCIDDVIGAKDATEVQEANGDEVSTLMAGAETSDTLVLSPNEGNQRNIGTI